MRVTWVYVWGRISRFTHRAPPSAWRRWQDVGTLPKARALGLQGRSLPLPSMHTARPTSMPPMCARFGADTLAQHPVGTAVDSRIKSCQQHCRPLPQGPSCSPVSCLLSTPVTPVSCGQDPPPGCGQHLRYKGLSESEDQEPGKLCGHYDPL